MIIPTVFIFMGQEGLDNAGPGLMFVAMPKVFQNMGGVGTVVGALFFIMVAFAALTSCISIMEAICSGMIDKGMSRHKATVTEGIIALVLSTVVCLGYNAFYFEFKLPNGTVGQILDIMDYASNNILMPVVTIGTCILVGWILKPDMIIAEATKNGEKFGREKLYRIMIRYVSPVLLLILLLRALGIF
jgi:NSS family neurotransmitter:Na+ symporter